MRIEQVTGDITQQPDVDAIVNAWNRNIIPWWLLLPQGVSGAIKKQAGTGPFSELGYRPLPLGAARLTSAGKLPNRAIIHVAGINMLWTASVASIRQSVISAVEMALAEGFSSIAMPLIGAGSGRFDEAASQALILRTLSDLRGSTPDDFRVRLVRYG